MKGPLAHQMAAACAQEAVDKTIAQHGEDNTAFRFCGFAWVTIKPARGAFVNECKRARIGMSGSYGGWRISSNDMFTCPPRLGQSMELKEIAARAYSNKLAEYGINASFGSRDD